MQRLISIAAVCIAFHATAQPWLPATTRADLAHLIAIASKEHDAQKLTTATQGRYPTALIHGRCMVGFLGKLQGSTTPLKDEHITWGARVGDIISFRIDAYHLDQLPAITALSYIELAHTLAPLLDRVVRAIRADSVQLGINLPQSYTGRDVLIGIPDFGFDYSHPMFYDTAMTASRVRAAWDQSKQSGPAPAGYSYGTAYTTEQELLTAATDTVGAWGIRDTHGTHVAGIAGGGGAGTAYRGVAFDAGFLFVSMLLDEASELDAFVWMQAISEQEDKRLVINMSWGKHQGTLDGTSLFDQAIDQLSLQGVVFAAANGNDGGVPFHIGHTFTSDTVRTRVDALNTSDPLYGGQSLLLCGEVGNSFVASIAAITNGGALLAASPWYNTSVQESFIDSMIVSGNDTLEFTLVCEAAHPLNGRPYLNFRVKRNSGAFRIALRYTATSGTVHAWNDVQYTNGLAGGAMAFQAPTAGWTPGDDQYAVSEPACANSVIAVGAYNAEYQTPGGTWVGGAGVSYSSKGPRLDGQLKPVISAPGENVASSINSYTDQSFTPVATVSFNGHDYPFARMSGTSMATPAVAGTVALMLEAAPDATAAEIKAAIMANARTDANTGTIPPGGSTIWGMGKLNAYHAVAEMLGVVGVPESNENDLLVWPNPANDMLYALVPDVGGSMRYMLVDLMGRIIDQGSSDGPLLTIDLKTRPAGAYVLHMFFGDVHIARSIIHR